VVLKLDGHGYSPTILHRILHLASVTTSFDVAAVALKVVGEISISAAHINNLASQVGQEMAADRDARTQQYAQQPLPRRARAVDVPPDLAAVFFDGGRMRTRQMHQGPGVHEAGWRETKNAAFHRMRSSSFDEDPQGELPESFRNEVHVKKLVGGLKNLKKEGREEEDAWDVKSTEAANPEDTSPPGERPTWQPETLFRTCLSSLGGSEEFGPMMAAEADARGFFTASKQAFLGDGQAYNWTIQRRWFPTFVPVTDFVHVVEYVYSAAKAIHEDEATRWGQYLRWATACWQGRAEEVKEELRQWQARVGPLPDGEEVPETDPRKILRSTVTYLTNNGCRMHYPRYRRQGLPVTSSLAESLVKQVSKRVKGTEKFWNDGPSGEAILQLRAAVLCDDDRLQNWIRTRPISPFSPRCRSRTPALSA